MLVKQNSILTIANDHQVHKTQGLQIHMFDESKGGMASASPQKTQTDWNKGTVTLVQASDEGAPVGATVQTKEEDCQTNFEAIPSNLNFPTSTTQQQQLM